MAFTVVEHWNAECVGWHVAKTGDQLAALQPLTMRLKQRCGSVGEGIARGLTVRMDNGSQYLSEHLQKQIKLRAIALSFAFVAQPETNGVVERFNKTIKEQVAQAVYIAISMSYGLRSGPLSKHATGTGEEKNSDSKILGKHGKNSTTNYSRRKRDSKLVSREPGALH